jgi:hypothetical protein
MSRRSPSLTVLAVAIALGCCFGATVTRAGNSPSASETSPQGADLSAALAKVRRAAQDIKLPLATVDVSGLGRDYGMRPGSAFTWNFLGGFLGAGLGGLLFGGGFFGGMHGGPGVLGVLVQMLLVYAIGAWLYRRCSAALAPAGNVAYARMIYPEAARLRGVVRAGFFGGGRNSRPMSLNAGDFRSFEELLHCLQSAWCAQDSHALRSLTTPEMAHAYLGQLSDLQCSHLHTSVSDVKISRTEVLEAWSDSRTDYATLRFTYTMIDATLDEWDRVVDGSDTEHVTVSEYWSFTRSARGHWLVSAIERAE